MVEDVDKSTGEQAKIRREKFIESGKATRFQSGLSGNPKGRPPGRGFLDIAKTFLDSGVKDDNGKPVVMEDLVRAVILQALAGHNVALKELLSRIEPAPNHNININNNVNTVNDKMFEFFEDMKARTETLEDAELSQLTEGDDDGQAEDS